MKIFKRLAISLSLYSRIPMPQFEWKDEDMKYAIGLLPVTGMIIGAVIYGLFYGFQILGERIGVSWPVSFTALAYVLVPLIITGGFHLDGFLDVQDAFKSYKPREEKLQILKDPHIGAFAIIGLCIMGIIHLMGMMLLVMGKRTDIFIIWCVTFSFVRCLTGITSICFKHAKKDGMLNTETKNADKKIMVLIIVQTVILAGIMLYVNYIAAIAGIAGVLLFTIYYRVKCYKELGGVTGDTAGYYVVVGETVMLVVLGITSFLL